MLAAAPAWPQRLADLAAFRKAADAYVADHFPSRPHLIGGAQPRCGCGRASAAPTG